MSGDPSRLERAIELILTAGLALSGAVLAAGLSLGSLRTLRAGVLLLTMTPVARVAAATAGLAYQRDWLFALISLAVLGVLACSAWVSWQAGW